MRTVKTFLTLALAALTVGAMAQTPPRPPQGGPGIRRGPGPGPGGVGGPAGPEMLMDPKVQRELHLTRAQVARIRALRPLPPRPGAKPPLPPRPGAAPATDARIEAILTKAQRAQFRVLLMRRDRPRPGGPLGAPRPGAPANGPRPSAGGQPSPRP